MNELQKRRPIGCIIVKDNEGQEVNICVGPKGDLGEKIVIIDSDKKVKGFEKTEDAIKFLKKIGVPFEERKRATEFILENLRAAEIMYDRLGFDSKISPSLLDFGIEKERFRK